MAGFVHKVFTRKARLPGLVPHFQSMSLVVRLLFAVQCLSSSFAFVYPASPCVARSLTKQHVQLQSTAFTQQQQCKQLHVAASTQAHCQRRTMIALLGGPNRRG
jgi:hypothetical protein